jgi:hypothetical protein
MMNVKNENIDLCKHVCKYIPHEAFVLWPIMFKVFIILMRAIHLGWVLMHCNVFYHSIVALLLCAF